MKISFILVNLLLTAALFAQGRIILPPPEEPRLPELPEPLKPVVLEELSADIRIRDHVARVRLEQTFYNPNRHNVEGTYLYSFDRDTRPGKFYLYINGKKTAGELLGAGKARKIYEDIVRRMKDPALLEFSGQGLLRARIFPFNGRDRRKIELSYDQTLRETQGLYKLQLPIRQSAQGRIESYSVVINLQTRGRLGTVYSPTHDISLKKIDEHRVEIRFGKKQVRGDQNFIIYYSESGGDIDGRLLSFRPRSDRDGYFMLFIKPRFPVREKNALPKDVVFVVDASGSMGGRKIKQARGALRFCVSQLNSGDRFDIIRFSGSTSRFGGRLTEAGARQKDDAFYFIDNIRPAGGTNIHQALREALDILNVPGEGRTKSIIMLTDGLPTEGLTDVRRIVESLNLNALNDIRLFSFGVGFDVNTYLLDRLAEESAGRTEYVLPGESIEAPVSQLFASISSPQLSDVTLNFGRTGVDDVYPAKISALYEDRAIIVTGRYRKGGTMPLEISGMRFGKRVSYKYRLELLDRNRENDFIAGMWAGRKVNHLLNRIRFEGENPEWVATIKELGRVYGLVTPYTSYLVREEKETLLEISRRRPAMRVLQNKRAMEDDISGEVMDMLAAPAMSASGSYGGMAVKKSMARKKMLGTTGRGRSMLATRRYIRGRAFALRGVEWVEEGLPQNISYIKITFNSPGYWFLYRSAAEVRYFLALGKNITFEWQGRYYRIME